MTDSRRTGILPLFFLLSDTHSPPDLLSDISWSTSSSHRSAVQPNGFIQKPDQLVTVDPYLIVSFFLRFVKDQLNAKVQMVRIDVIDIFRGTVSRPSQISDYVSRLYNRSFFQIFRIGDILPQVGVIVIPFSVKASDTDAPAAVLIPAQRLHVSGFDCNDRRPYLSQQIMPQVVPAVSIASGCAEIIIILVRKILAIGLNAFRPYTSAHSFCPFSPSCSI